MSEKPYWETEEYEVAEADLDARSKALTGEIRLKVASLYLAEEMDLDPEAIENFVNDLWNPLREMAMDSSTVNVVLDALIQSISGEASRDVDEILGFGDWDAIDWKERHAG